MKDVPIVLVVEDEEPLQEIVHDALKDGGFDLTTVASGEDAVAMIESGVVKYSALVTDINLKGPMKGWEVARLVRQIDPAFPIVYMTGAAADGWASEGVPKQAVCYRAIGYGGVPTAQHRLADLTGADRRPIADGITSSRQRHHGGQVAGGAHLERTSRHHRDTMRAINDGVSALGKSRHALVTLDIRSASAAFRKGSGIANVPMRGRVRFRPNLKLAVAYFEFMVSETGKWGWP